MRINKALVMAAVFSALTLLGFGTSATGSSAAPMTAGHTIVSSGVQPMACITTCWGGHV
jgi:hypothetical protein